MDTTVGVVGPDDLVESVAALCEEQPGVRTRRLPYRHESMAPQIVDSNAAEVDAWLFTGVIPYTLAEGALTRPAVYVDYTGPTLLQALVRLLLDGRDISHVTVDTLTSADVTEVFEELGIPTNGIHSLAFRPGVTSQSLVDFHRRHASSSTAAITCVSTVYDELENEMTILRLVPSWHSIRTAIRQLLLTTTNQIQEDSQIALGIVESGAGFGADLAADIAAEAAALAGTVTDFGDGTKLIVTTRGRLVESTDGLTSAPLLHRLTHEHGSIHLGFGLGHSAVEAERLARRALARSRKHGPVAAVASFRNDLDILLDADAQTIAGESGSQKASIGVVAARVGLSVPTMQRLQEIAAAVGDEPVTTRRVADSLGVQPRTARRILQRLEMAGFAERSGHLSPGTSGRPLTIYRLAL